MKVTIEISQSAFSEEWDVNVKTEDGGISTMAYWSTDELAQLLNLVGKHFQQAICRAGSKPND